MPTYISLMKLTEQGIKDIKGAPSRIEAASKGIEALGGKLIEVYAVMGEYDYVTIAEFPNDETAMAFMLSLGSAGNVRSNSLKAFPSEQYVGIVQELP